jgi:nucleotide-binding universal stress UspA family protein
LARVLAGSMRASVTVLGFAPDSPSDDLREVVERRAQESGLGDAEVHTGSGNLSQQIAAQCANALFELVIIPRQLGARKPALDREVIAFLEGADIPAIVAPADSKPLVSRILICTRAGEPGKSDIRIGGRLARHLGARVTLLHITHRDAEAHSLVRRHLTQASAALSSLEVTNEILTRIDTNPAEGILREAAEYDLTVVGGHGPQVRSLFARDDITLQVLARGRNPVLVVPAEQ